MTTTEALRRQVKRSVDKADERSLKIVQAILDIEDGKDWWDELAVEERRSVERGLKDVADGKLTPHADVMKKYKKWL
jgi:predicted transcriptional regulator